MNTQRYQLSRYGVSRFEIVDTKARPIARQFRVLDAMPLTDAEAIVRELNSLSDKAKAARLPRPPEELVGTLEDRPHREPGVVRAAKSVRIK